MSHAVSAKKTNLSKSHRPCRDERTTWTGIAASPMGHGWTALLARRILTLQVGGSGHVFGLFVRSI